MPEYVEPLRKEIESVLDPDGNIDKKAFGQLVKLDSIMKESQRFNPLLLSKFDPGCRSLVVNLSFFSCKARLSAFLWQAYVRRMPEDLLPFWTADK